MCECKKNLEQKLNEHYAKQMPEAKELEVKLTGYAFVIEGNAMRQKPVMPVEIRHTVTAKKTGTTKRKIEESSMTFSFCPFCGESLKAKS